VPDALSTFEISVESGYTRNEPVMNAGDGLNVLSRGKRGGAFFILSHGGKR